MPKSASIEEMRSQIILDKKVDSVLIKNLEIKDHELYEVILDQEELERPEFVKRALKVGAIALKDVLVTEKIDYVKKEFERLCFELDRIFKLELGKEGMKGELDRIFSDDGTLKQSLEDVFGDNGRLIRDVLDMNNKNSPIGQLRETIESYFVGKDSEIYGLLDPNARDSPMSRLRQEIIEKLEKIQGDIETYLAKREIIEKAPQKGFIFEDTLEEFLLNITKPFCDCLERVGTEKGKLGNLKGDFVITLNDPTISGQPPRIVVEAKAGENVRMTLKSLLGELRDAIKNRESHFAIAVTEKTISDSMGCYREAEGDKIICAFGDNGLPLEVAYRAARTYLLIKMRQAPEKFLDTTEIHGIISKISNDLNAIKGIRAKLTKIEATSQDIAADIRSLETNIRDSLEELQTILHSSEPIDTS